MKRIRSFILSAILIPLGLGIAYHVHAEIGDRLSVSKEGTDTGVFRVDSNNQVYRRVAVEVVTANKTLVEKDTGLHIGVSGANITVALPALTANNLGMEFTISDVNGNAYNVDPNGNDLIAFSTNSAGDQILSAGTAGDSVTVYGVSPALWAIRNMQGTHTDNN